MADVFQIGRGRAVRFAQRAGENRHQPGAGIGGDALRQGGVDRAADEDHWNTLSLYGIFQRGEFLLAHGAIDLIIPRHELRARLARLLAQFTHQPTPVEVPRYA